MKQWSVDIQGLGGPHDDFVDRRYIVSTEGSVEAISRAVDAFTKEWADQIKPVEIQSIECAASTSVRVL